MKSKVTSALLVPASTTEYAQMGTINSLAIAFQDSQVSCATVLVRCDTTYKKVYRMVFFPYRNRKKISHVFLSI